MRRRSRNRGFCGKRPWDRNRGHISGYHRSAQQRLGPVPTGRDGCVDDNRNNAYDNRQQNVQARRVRNERRQSKRTMGFLDVLKLLDNEDLQDVILQLSNDKNGFTRLLDSKNISNDFIVLLVRLLWKICGSTFQDVKITILSAALNSRFMEKLTLYITKLISQTPAEKLKNRYFWDDPVNFWANLVNFSRTVNEIIPSNCETIRTLLKTITVFFSLTEVTHSVHISDEIRAQILSILDLVEETFKTLEVKRQTRDLNPEDIEPPNDYRDIPIIPSVQETVAEFSPFLRPNIVDRAYNNINHYLDIQFRLLREDFVAPLRRGITTFLLNQLKPKKDRKKLDDIKVHSPIRFLSIETVNDCSCYKIRFDFGKKKRSFLYENSKSFMFGSLVCFTCDNFKNLLFGKIVHRDLKLLQRGLLIVGFQEQVNINYEIDYLMVESSVYFEPYYQVLGVLKRMNTETFPMEKYIIRVEIQSNPPKYLRKTEPVFYEIEGSKFCPLNFPAEPRFYNLNDSQLAAFKAALTQEFCIIQGPPGTGKTFLGLKIAHTLLKNKDAWYNKTPILVICYTNHALDQFLEGILPVTQNILRVGGQSKKETLQNYNLTTKRRNINYETAVHQKSREVKVYMARTRKLNETLNQIDMNESVVSFTAFEEVIENYHETWFAKANQDDIIKWLLEGKTRDPDITRNRSNQQQIQDDIQDMQVDNEEEESEDLNLEEHRNTDSLDDVFTDLQGRGCGSLFTLQQLRDKLEILKEELAIIVNQPGDLRLFLRQREIETKIRDTETDFYYISNQLEMYKDRRYIRKPEHVDLQNPFNIHPQNRWQLYFYWLEQYATHLRRKYDDCSHKFKVLFRNYSQLRDIEDMRLMKKHLLVGMTTTGAARLQSSLQALQNPIVIVEEAAEVLEAHIVASLTNHCQHLILIGDHLQLKPGAADFQIKTKFKLGISLFERMVNNNIHCYTLDVQHRMRPEISRLIRPHIYPHLVDHENTLQRAPILGMEKCIYFIDHQEREELCQDDSKRNVHESQFLIALARHLILNGYKPEQITILATYLGQFFEMRREKIKPSNKMLLQDVRIAVLDNYQGEESDIILLSLVRSNAENKAGFIRIQNRVCVALSRARNGFYIVGNMSLLLRSDSENHIWRKVKAVLEEQNAIGPNLTLKCQIHPDRLTQVSKSQDFVKLSEGGCDLMCQSQIACGHICKRLCHVRDRGHQRYKCNEKCTRLLCNEPDHICNKLCYEDCGPCTYLVPRDLECGHKVNIECHIDPSNYKCHELVLTKLPCGHMGDKPCSVDPNNFICSHPCDRRVEPCGHSCDRHCHIWRDPDHLQYICRKPCAKPQIGCKEKDNKHRCPRFCFQECEICTISVRKTRSCGHVFPIACNLDVEDMECNKLCRKTLPCGHKCRNKCMEKCGPCKIFVEKIIPTCGHKTYIKCYEVPTRQHCRSRDCPRLLPCGHKCTIPCKFACTNTCRVLIDCSIQAPCGHTLTEIQCSNKHTNDADLLLKNCTEPCGVELKCKHKCSGTCGKCMQSRIHIRCIEKCGVPLVCNHECLIPCREACKPCERPCDMKCKHSRCMKNCGEPCTPCKNPCPRECPHVKCPKLCGEICSVDPCIEKCPKSLKCGHPCVGFCGDPCPPLCRICNKAELTEYLFGTEDEEDAVFVLLRDCKHVLEHSGLKNWLDQDGNQIQFKTCPKCKANITTTERYSDYVKRAIQDVNLAKLKSYGQFKLNEELRQQILDDLLNLSQTCKKNLLLVCRKLADVFSLLESRLKPSRNDRRQPINKIELNAVKSKIQMLSYIIDCFKESKEKFHSEDHSIISLNLLLDVLMRSEDHVTNQEIEDVELEIKRLNRIVLFDRVKKSNKFHHAQPIGLVQSLVKNIEEILFENGRYANSVDDKVKVILKDLAAKVDCTLIISDRERMEIVAAIGMAKGHWFKCPNGHAYVIGNCGGAYQTSRCPCGASIGGTSYHLQPGNRPALEMDGSDRPAYHNFIS